MFTLETAAAHWDALADEQQSEEGPAARSRVNTYRRTAQALRMEIETGVSVCVCCFKPTGAGPTFLRTNT